MILLKGKCPVKVLISADSTCDLTPELIKKYNIGITPLYIVMNGKSYRDGIEVRPESIYARVSGGGEIPSTAAVSVDDYLTFFKMRLEECDAVVHMHISSEMSACWQNASIAARELGHVFPVDSRNLSTGIGHLVLDAAEMAAEGMDAETIFMELERRKAKLNVSFLVDTLAYLRKGGRCSAMTAMGANLLSLKPCIEVHGGKMDVGKKYRGHIEKCLLQYVRDRLEDRDDIDTRRIFITDSGGLSDETRLAVEREVRRCQSFEEVIHTRAGCTVSNHCGPGTLGILYYNK